MDGDEVIIKGVYEVVIVWRVRRVSEIRRIGEGSTCGFSEAAFRTVSSTERIKQAASVAAVKELVLMRVGSQTKLANVSHAVSFAMSTPYHLCPKKRKEKK